MYSKPNPTNYALLKLIRKFIPNFQAHAKIKEICHFLNNWDSDSNPQNNQSIDNQNMTEGL